MAWRRQAGRKRAPDAGVLDLRLRPQDRTGGPPAARGDGGRRRREAAPPRETRKRRRGRGGKGRSGIGRLIYWGAVLALWAVIGGNRHARLDRHPPAADPVAGNSQAAALGADPRRQRRNARHARRHGRRRGTAARTAGLRAQGLHRHRGSPLLFASRRRSVGHHARRHQGRVAARRLARRFHHHPAARQEPVLDAGAHRVAQAAGGGARLLARAQVHQGRDPRTLSQPRLFRFRRLRRGSRRPALFRQIGAAIDARRGRHAGRSGAIAVTAGAEP